MSAAGTIIQTINVYPAAETFPQVATLKPEHFTDSDHRKLFALYLKRCESGQPVNESLILSDLAEEMPLDKANDLLNRNLDAGHCLSTDLKPHVDKLLQENERSRKLAALEIAKEKLLDKRSNPQKVFAELMDREAAMQSGSQSNDVLSAQDACRNFLNTATLERSHTGALEGLSTGIPRLDEITTGIRHGEMWVIGGLPGRGKTALGCQFASTNARAGHPVLFFSLEMTGTELIRRMAGGYSIGATAARSLGYVSDAKWNLLTDYVEQVSTWPLTIVQSAELTPAQLGTRARIEIKRSGIELIVVDYLQLLNGPGKEMRERVGNSANALRQLAKDTGVPVVVLSQLRRPSGGLNERPSMIELRESGEIESHAHTVLLCYLPQSGDGQPTGEDEIIVGKQRNGPLGGSLPVFLDKQSLQFKPREYVPSEEAPKGRTKRR